MKKEEKTGLSHFLLNEPLEKIIRSSASVRDSGFSNMMTYSRKVFIPLTQLCRDVCHYCTFAKEKREVIGAYVEPEEVLDTVQLAKSKGCKEVLLTLGDKPELRYNVAKEHLKKLGYKTTVEYVRKIAEMIIEKTELLPHINCGVLTKEELKALREVAPSIGLMLESSSNRLCEKGGPHYGSPDKRPEVRLKCIEEAGELKIPFTSGILVGIGETRTECLQSLFDLYELHEKHGHIQEVIIQNFIPKENTLMRSHPAPKVEDLLWAIGAARLIFGANMSIQTPPNLNLGNLEELINAGINDWGGISPLTPDYVNPESEWPEIENLAAVVNSQHKVLIERLTIYPEYIKNREVWLEKSLFKSVLMLSDSSGHARCDNWKAGMVTPIPKNSFNKNLQVSNNELRPIVNKCFSGKTLRINEIVKLFSSRGDQLQYVFNAANALREQECGNDVTYVLNRNINYTNVCSYKCSFCSFSRKSIKETTLEAQYLLNLDDIVQRSSEAYNMGMTEVCLQGGIHPDFTGNTYLEVCRAIKKAVPNIHIHAFSPVEINHGAQTLNISVREFLQELKLLGLGSLPGTAAEILNDDVRRKLSCNKITSETWLATIKQAHDVGLPTTSTIMFGHLETLENWAEHLLKVRHLQADGGKITEFVPLPFVHMKSPVYLKGWARTGPTFREVLLMHAVSRLVLYPFINNVQVSWPKLGIQGALACLEVGANDFGGCLINESISRAAGAEHGQQLTVENIKSSLLSINRTPKQRSTAYEIIAEADSARAV